MSSNRLSRCRWPSLQEPYAAALREAIAFVFDETIPLGIIATGTIIRGRPDPASDLDIYVLHDTTFRRRIQRFFQGIATEIFINPPHAVRSYLTEEHQRGRPITAHMLATGVVIYDADPVVEQLRKESRDWLARPSILSPEDAIRARYAAATRLEDGADVSAVDGPTAAMLVTQAVTAMLELWLRSRAELLPRSKELIATIAARDTDLGNLAESFFSSTTAAERLDAAQRIGDRTLGTRGFFAWDSGPDPVKVSALAEQFGEIDIYLFDQLLRGRIAPGMRILDAGCGTGRNLVYLLQAGYEVFGADTNPTAIAQVRALAARLAPALPANNFRVEPLAALSFVELFADVVICSAVLHFASDDIQFNEMLQGCWKALKPGGLFVCRLTSSIGLDGRGQSLGGRRYRLPDGSERYLVDELLLMALTNELGGELLDPLKTTVVQGQRCMTTWVVRKRR